VTDQAELYGLLAKVRDLGTNLISVETIDAQVDGMSDELEPAARTATMCP
jgi:hypothetical protein